MRPVVTKTTTFIGMMLIIGGSLSACSKKSDSDPLVIPASSARGGMDDQFGKGFEKAFRANPNSEPRKVEEIDLKPVSLTTEPIAIN